MAIRIAVAGMGARGQDWVREVRAAPAFELVACVDHDNLQTVAILEACVRSAAEERPVNPQELLVAH